MFPYLEMFVLKCDCGPLWIALSCVNNQNPNFSPAEVAAINERFAQDNLDIRRIRRVNGRNGHYFRVTCPRMIWFRQDWVDVLLGPQREPVDLMHWFAGSPPAENSDAQSPSEEGA